MDLFRKTIRYRGEAIDKQRDIEREEKASRTAGLVYLQAQGQPIWTNRDYSSLVREGYTRNVIVYRSVRMIAEAVASVSWVMTEEGRELDQHPVLDLMKQPNEMQSGRQFMEAIVVNLLLSGNAYVESVRLNGSLRELYCLRPDRMKVVAGENGWPDGYVYTIGGQSVRFEPDEMDLSPILHLTSYHPLNDHYGMSPLEAAQTALDVHNTASAWNKALLDNAARPSGALVYHGSEGNLSNEQFDRLKSELEESFQGSKNAGRPLLLEGGLDWKAMSLSPKDMDFFEARNAAAREIALAFGVPPQLLGIPGDNTYSNYQEANRAFWRQTILPLLRKLSGAFEGWLKKHHGAVFSLSFNEASITALAEERNSALQRLLDADFLTINEKRAALDYEPIADGDRL